jgi:hypothetical protein
MASLVTSWPLWTLSIYHSWTCHSCLQLAQQWPQNSSLSKDAPCTISLAPNEHGFLVDSPTELTLGQKAVSQQLAGRQCRKRLIILQIQCLLSLLFFFKSQILGPWESRFSGIFRLTAIFFPSTGNWTQGVPFLRSVFYCDRIYIKQIQVLQFDHFKCKLRSIYSIQIVVSWPPWAHFRINFDKDFCNS